MSESTNTSPVIRGDFDRSWFQAEPEKSPWKVTIQLPGSVGMRAGEFKGLSGDFFNESSRIHQAKKKELGYWKARKVEVATCDLERTQLIQSIFPGATYVDRPPKKKLPFWKADIHWVAGGIGVSGPWEYPNQVTRCKLAVPNGEIEISAEKWVEFNTYACTFNFVIDAKDWQTEESLAVVNGLVSRLTDYLVERNANRFQLEWIDMSELESEKQRECSR
jgi:hypothetical protein